MAIKLSEKFEFDWMIASGAWGFDGEGWLWHWPLKWLGLIDPSLFAVVMRTVTRHPRLYPDSNLSWPRPWTWFPWSPWSCIRFIPGGGVVNKVGLYNPGIDWWVKTHGETIDFYNNKLIGSIFGNEEELKYMIHEMNRFGFRGVELNCSCPNSGHGMSEADAIIDMVPRLAKESRHPFILKISAGQDYMKIATGLRGVVKAISLNSVPYAKVFPNGPTSPVEHIGKPGSGPGGVSGRPAQKHNWKALEEMAAIPDGIPVIGPSGMSHIDVPRIRKLGAQATVFGVINIFNPIKSTQIVRKEIGYVKSKRN